MKVAIIGCGFIANTHAKAIRAMGHELYIAVDSSAESAGRFAEKWGAKKTGSYIEDALAPEIDAVHICTPPLTHYELVKKVIAAGKHVICEKPLCPDPVKAKELYELAKASGKVHATNFNVRYHEACGRAKGIISDRSFGDILFIHGTYLQEFHVLPTDYSWRYKPELAGPMRATTEIGSHILDLMRFWTGLEITAVSANFGAFTPDRYVKDGVMYRENKEGAEKIRVESDDVAMASLRFSNGAVGNMLISEISHGRSNYVKLEVSGTERSVWWESENPYHLHTASGMRGGALDRLNAFGGGFPDTFQSLFEDIYAAIQGEDRRYPSFYDGYMSSLICDTIYLSAQSGGKWTELKR